VGILRRFFGVRLRNPGQFGQFMLGQDHHKKDDQMQHKPGAYTLNLGVLDHTTNLIGTTVTVQ